MTDEVLQLASEVGDTWTIVRVAIDEGDDMDAGVVSLSRKAPRRRAVVSTRWPTLLVALVAGALVLSGCGDDKGDDASKPSAKDTLPRTYETPEGKVAFSEGGDTVTIETPEGKSLLINGRLPDDFPDGFPILKGAKIQTSSVQPKSDSIVQTTRYFVELGGAEAYEQYLDLLVAAGYRLGEKTRVDDGPAGFDGSITFKGEGDRSKQSGLVSVSLNKAQVQVSVTLTILK
ncbi:MAG: hypothetical protein HYR89_00780 [Actinobacteria bacterium]|nr:hypothetical protein [Actinomycetota bacterium]